MRNRVHITKTKFYLNPEKKVVTCVLDVDMQLYRHPNWDLIYEDAWKKKFPFVTDSGKFQVVGKATCNTEDDFSISKGKRLAESRAKLKALKMAINVYDSIEAYLVLGYSKIKSSGHACRVAYLQEANHIEKLLESY